MLGTITQYRAEIIGCARGCAVFGRGMQLFPGGQRGSAGLTLSQTAAKEPFSFQLENGPKLFESPPIYCEPTRLVVIHDDSRAGAGRRKNTHPLEEQERRDR